MTKANTLFQLISQEQKRQEQTLNLIPSENYTYPEVLRALGSRLQDKYSEGYPGRRYYPGNKIIDKIEKLAQEKALSAFNLNKNESNWHANVQPLSGSPAMLAVYWALARPGEKIMGLKLNSGGHLSHGHKVSVSGQFWQSVQYDVDPKTGRLEFDTILTLAKNEKPKIIVSGFTAYPQVIDFQKFGQIAKEVGAYHVADISHIAGLVVAGQHPSPFPYADIVVTTTHKTLRGPRGAVIFSKKSQIQNHKSQINSKLQTQNSKQTIAQAIDRAVFPGLQGGPHDNVTAAKAICFQKAASPEFKNYASQLVKNAKALAGQLKALGFTLITGGTGTHLILTDVTKLGLDGAQAEKRLEAVGILANRNTVPGDTKPFKPSGLRLGTPTLTSRGMKGPQMRQIAQLIYETLTETRPLPELKKQVLTLTSQFPLP